MAEVLLCCVCFCFFFALSLSIHTNQFCTSSFMNICRLVLFFFSHYVIFFSLSLVSITRLLIVAASRTAVLTDTRRRPRGPIFPGTWYPCSPSRPIIASHSRRFPGNPMAAAGHLEHGLVFCGDWHCSRKAVLLQARASPVLSRRITIPALMRTGSLTSSLPSRVRAIFHVL